MLCDAFLRGQQKTSGALIVVADDSRDSLRWACRSLVAPPPGITWAHVLLDTAVKLLRRRPEVASWISAGRVVVGRTA